MALACTLSLVVLTTSPGCSDGGSVSRQEPVVTPSVPVPSTVDWARHVEPVRAEPDGRPARWPVRSAVMGDHSEASDELVTARRLVYRVAFVVPPSFRQTRERLVPSAAELEVDLSRDRLRARFVGSGWPLPPGTEVRLRADLPGVYVFDDQGGRALGPGELASWFEGRAGGARSRVRVRREVTEDVTGPSEPMCLLLAEWTAQEREEIVRRCSDGSIPPAFGFGPWRAELTAMVPLQLPRRALRADAVDPPGPIPRATSGAVLGVEELASIAPAEHARDGSRAALEVVNHTDSRLIVVVGGVPVGWVAASASATLDGLLAGTHRVGALRPLGVARATPRPTQVPGGFTIGRPPRDAADEP